MRRTLSKQRKKLKTLKTLKTHKKRLKTGYLCEQPLKNLEKGTQTSNKKKKRKFKETLRKQ